MKIDLPPLISTDQGKLRVGIELDPDSDQGEIVWLRFEPIFDVKNSARAFKRSGLKMRFMIWGASSKQKTFWVYLGDPDGPWRPEYAIELHRRLENSGYRWEASDAEVKRTKSFWCAAEAQLTVFVEPTQQVMRMDTNANGVYLSTRIGLQHVQLYSSLHQQVIKDIRELDQQSLVTSPFEAQLRGILERTLTRPGSQLYQRMRECWPNYKKALQTILNDPHKSDVWQPQLVKFDELCHDLQILEFHGQSRMSITKLVPEAIVVPKPISSLDTPENRFVFESLKRVSHHLSAIAYELNSYIQDSQEHIDSAPDLKKTHPWFIRLEQHEEELKTLKLWQSQCRDFESALTQLGINHTNAATLTSAVLDYNPHYSLLRRLSFLMDIVMSQRDPQGEAISFSVAPFHELYQQWALYKIVEALETLGFQHNGTGERTVAFYRIPQFNSEYVCLVHPDDSSVELRVWYERRYPFATNKNKVIDYGFEDRSSRVYDIPANPEDRKFNPDIAIECWGIVEGYPLIIIFDPTLANTLDLCKKKYLYMKTLRHFSLENEEGEALKIVKAAWAVSPSVNKYSLNSPYIDLGPRYRQGTILLNHTPNSSVMLVETIRSIMLECGIFAKTSKLYMTLKNP
jgi:Domain of unknown function (DUF2357)